MTRPIPFTIFPIAWVTSVVASVLPDILLHFQAPFTSLTDARKLNYKFQNLPNRDRNQDFVLILISTLAIIFAFYRHDIARDTFDIFVFVAIVALIAKLAILFVDHAFFQLITRNRSDKNRVEQLFFKSSLNSLFLLFGVWLACLSFVFPYGGIDESIIGFMSSWVLTQCVDSIFLDTCVREEYSNIVIIMTDSLVVITAMILALSTRCAVSMSMYREIKPRDFFTYLFSNSRNVLAMVLLIFATLTLIRIIFGSIILNFDVLHLYFDRFFFW